MPGRNKDCTSFELEKSLRSRMKIVAALSRKPSMIAWLEEKVREDEIRFRVPVSENESPVPVDEDLPRDS